MNKQNHPFRLRRWLNDIPIEDPINRQMAFLLQVMLLGLIAIILVATVVNLIRAFLTHIKFSFSCLYSFIFR